MSAGATPAGAFVEGPRGPLYATVHPAAGDGATEGVVLVAPFGEERQDAHEVLRSLALALSAAGVSVLRFDLYGTGDAAGAWEDATPTGWLDDIAAMTSLLRRETGASRVGLVGLRFGATLAAHAASQSEADWVGLVQPVLRGDAYAMELLRAYLAAEMALHKKAGTTREALLARLAAGETVNLFGYGYTPAQHAELGAMDTAKALNAWGGDALLVEVLRTATARQSKDFAALAEAMGPRLTQVQAVEAQSLYTEGKVRQVEAPEVTRRVLDYLAARKEQG